MLAYLQVTLDKNVYQMHNVVQNLLQYYKAEFNLVFINIFFNFMFILVFATLLYVIF